MKSLSLTLRALTALLLMVAFYIFALGVAGVLLFIPYAEWQSGTLHLKIDLICIVTAGLILWSIMPRRNKFIPPGAELTKEEQPELFEVIERVSYSTNQKMPDSVYLILDMNAWVSEKGGFMGFNKKRIMGIGLPLMQTMNISELEAIIAHEFGHYYGGDTKLSPIIFRTRSAIERTLENLEESIIQAPFRMFAKLFFRISHGISRHQEYCADKIAAETAGAKPFITGMEKLNGASLKYDYYWSNEVVHLLNCGLKPSIADGFNKCIKSNRMNKIVEEELKNQEDEHDPYSTHPPIIERINAVRYLDRGYTKVNEEIAVTLLNNVDELEKKTFMIIYGEEGEKLQETKWDNITLDLYLKGWETYIEKYRNDFMPMTFYDFYSNINNTTSDFYDKIRLRDKYFTDENVNEIAEWISGIALMTTLNKNGWAFEKVPGEEVLMKKENEIIEPMTIFEDIKKGRISEVEWKIMIEKNKLQNITISLG